MEFVTNVLTGAIGDLIENEIGQRWPKFRDDVNG
ncbi:hypothetical protein RB2150_12036 [Rhodobacteraceae bacterium HTCC2150]|nr:hypothetical protein RB2150_12036 [Rhodobacteraceae bacterium HTCC2150]